MQSRSSYIVGAGEPDFPVELRLLPQPVAALWYVGRLPAHGERAVAIVGSRAATLAACGRATSLAAALAGRGYAVISGGALGIDAAAHRGALAAGGSTFAVLGCGIDVVYPDRHGPLYAAIAADGGVQGGVLTELPPGTPPRRGHFPVRNRIVAALAEAVVVVEARRQSGALITARLGRQMGRRLFAVPGSAGTDALIASGAAMSVEDPAALLAGLVRQDHRPEPVVPAALAALVAALRAGPAAPAELAARMSVPLPLALGRLVEAELAGWAQRLPGGRFEVPRAS
jgi:DNA processing protein